MTNLIAKVAELRELEAKATPGPWDMNYNGSYEIFTAGHGPSESRDKTVMRWKDDGLPIRAKDSVLILVMRNAAPKLLAALGKVQAGDAKILAEILSFIESEATESDWEDAIGLLRRYADLARLMEGKE
jgi:hypothetical protein